MKWAIRISNSHFPLTKIEVEEVLQIKINWIIELVGIVECDEQTIKKLLKISAGIKFVIMLEEVITSLTTPTAESLQDHTFSFLEQIPEGQTFAVRYHKIQHLGNLPSRSNIEIILGTKIANRLGLKVDLENPDWKFIFLQKNEIVITGWLYAESQFQKISERSPKESPFFGGGAMKPMLSKLMVNLLYPHSATILDPFSGHGGILREISDLQVFGVGFEISDKIAREANINNKYHKEGNLAVLIADALHPPLRLNSIEQVVTDPPYANQSTTIGRDKEELVNYWLDQADANKIIMALPDSMKIQITDKWDLQYAYKDYVHRSLTRVIRKMVLRI